MTNEEAIKTLKANVMVACDTSDKVGYETPLNKAIEQALEMAIKALEQEPCKDAVSRQAVLDFMQIKMGGKELYKAVYEMPSVRPMHKKGKWIKSDIGGAKVCSICYAHMGLSNFKYCPNCGAEMDCVTLDDVFDNTVKEMTHEERVLIELTRDMPKKMGVLYIQSFQQEHGPFTDEAAELIRKYLSKE